MTSPIDDAQELQSNLFGFLNSQVKEASTKDELVTEIETMLLERLREEGEEIGTLTLGRLLEVLHKNNTDKSANIVKIFQAAQEGMGKLPEAPANNPIKDITDDKGNKVIIQKSEINTANNALKFIRGNNET